MAVKKISKTEHPPAYKPLTPDQGRAIDLLILGRPDAEIAEAVGVTRETMTHWRQDHPVFQAELNRRHQSLWANTHDRLRALMSKAVDTIEQAVNAGDLRAAIEVVKVIKLYGGINAPQGLTDPDAILRGKAEAQARRELGDNDPLQMALRRLDGGHHENVQARTEELLEELREPFCDSSN